MNKSELVLLFCKIIETDNEECEDIKIKYETKIHYACDQLNITFKNIFQALNLIHKDLHFINEFYENLEWKIVCISVYILYLINIELEQKEEELISVQECKNIQKHLKNLTFIGIYSKIQPNLPFYNKNGNTKHENVFLSYNILKWTISALCFLLKAPNLRIIMLPECFRGILVALYQISFCPLKKPSQDIIVSKSTDFIMTKDIYDKLLEEKEHFKHILNNLQSSMHVGLFVKELMIIFQSTTPIWFKKAVSQTLTNILRTKNGLENIIITLLDGADNDSTKTWRILNVIAKLIVSSKNLPDFKQNISKQLANLPEKALSLDEKYLIYERIFCYCTRSLFVVDETFTKELLVRPVMNQFLYFTYKNSNIKDGEDLTAKYSQNVRLLHGIFLESSGDVPHLPLELIKPIINVLFRFYSLTVKPSPFDILNRELKDILIKFLKLNEHDLFKLFDSFIFNVNVSDLIPIRSDVNLEIIKNNIVLHLTDYTVTYSTNENGESIMELLKDHKNLQVKFFGYLLMCLTKKELYFPSNNSDDLLAVESEFMNEFFERRLTVYKLLSILAEDKLIQKEIINSPEDVIRYVENAILQANDIDKNCESDEFQTFFTIIMILHAFVTNCDQNQIEKFKCLIEPLEKLTVNNSNAELTDLMKNILRTLGSISENVQQRNVEQEKTDLDKAIEDICDPLLPVRGHGIMTLTKLVQRKDENVINRKQYVLNIFQQNLKHDDSFIYLSAIQGLAAMAYLFPDAILNILCEEYSDFTRNDDQTEGHEVRMKIGEVLVATTKTLGDMAPKYKPLLLNTFLNGTKDDDGLIRASSLSNLGEICRILGYKLGTIATEILVCVHAIIATDKSVEARRGGVTVIRQLFVGLDSEMIAFLKDDILPIYRTLKQIYHNDKDDVMRLQAQLALEELNENMKKILFPQVQLHDSKKFIILNDK